MKSANVRAISVAIAGMLLLASAVFFGIELTVNRAVSVDADRKARDWAAYFIGKMPNLDELISTGQADAAQLSVIAAAEHVGDVFRFKLFDRQGRTVLVSDEAAYAKEGGAGEHSAKAAEVLRTGNSDVSLNDGTGKKNRPPLYVEAYVPVIDAQGSTRGVVEVYIDQTGTASLFKATFMLLAIGLAAAAALMFGLPTLAFISRSRQAAEAKRRVEYLAKYEPMTGVLNRASFTERLSELLARNVPDRQLAIIFLDVDDFKTINDTYGHEAGDEFLKHVARCVMGCCGADDLAARMGGDEFTLAVRRDSTQDVTDTVERLMRAIGEPILTRGKTIYGRISCGVYVVEEQIGLADAMHKADVALYQAKMDGKNTYRLFCDSMEDTMRARLELEQRVRDAVSWQSFELHYQPLLRADNGTCIGFEALLRLTDGEGGFIPPSSFIPVLEAMGHINEVGKWVIEQATATAALWPEPLTVSVNLSVRQFQDGKLVGYVREALRKSGLSAGRLEIEVTESMLMENTENVSSQLRELRSLGVSIAMDDFGTGYSSLGYLWQFGFDKLKIDRSFVSALERNDRQARDILDTIIMLGHKLDMSVTAEGIETDHQAEVLTSLACDHFQGYLYGRPRPASEIPAFLLEGKRKQMAAASSAAPSAPRLFAAGA
ncbi:bifunctional diguanylate cyclase/phosphodiesterase [Pseudaminobacter sp. 19-2017]|uniref:Bifunctional diguanylate cyclase/phosphodiesterase n=1 Tax=Pseudaminobacter soli (ex Zhang et al. 2022) TaxID=2831468 RepID=A0A942E4E0_9HYPH|nr:bifunctional diguanylate cyclase/phosphodiesterase [Pseudaminobacter soli]MBS3650935.1 bifunctional diguanylate cyclase/phosphodiesterase [Pseudaminobacter soli]